MSRARKLKLTTTNASSHRRGSRYHLFGFGMGPPQLLGLCLEFNRVLEDRVVPVPLREVLPAHEGAVLGGAPVIVPEVEVEEIDRVGELGAADDLVGAKALVNLLGRLHLLVGAGDGLLRLVVDAFDDRTRVALYAGFFHARLSGGVAGTLRGDLGGEQIREPLARVVRYLLAVEPAHVTGGT